MSSTKVCNYPTRGFYSALTWRSGELQSVDGYMNIALEQTKEYVNGRLHRTYGDAFVRGNNGMLEFVYLSIDESDTRNSALHFCRLIRITTRISSICEGQESLDSVKDGANDRRRHKCLHTKSFSQPSTGSNTTLWPYAELA